MAENGITSGKASGGVGFLLFFAQTVFEKLDISLFLFKAGFLQPQAFFVG